MGIPFSEFALGQSSLAMTNCWTQQLTWPPPFFRQLLPIPLPLAFQPRGLRDGNPPHLRVRYDSGEAFPPKASKGEWTLATSTLDQTCSWCGVARQGAFSTTFIPNLKQKHYFASRRKASGSKGTISLPGDISWSWERTLGTEVPQGDVAYHLSSVFENTHTQKTEPCAEVLPVVNGHTPCGQPAKLASLPSPAMRNGRDIISLVFLSSTHHVSS